MPKSSPTTPRDFRVVGIHLAGAQNPRTAIVRGRFQSACAWSGEQGWRHERLQEQLKRWTGLNEVRALASPSQTLGASAGPQKPAGLGVSPFVVDAFLSELGPLRDQDADSALIQALMDLGPADFYVIDTALGLPPCLACEEACPGVSSCSVVEVAAMRRFWESQRKHGRRLRTVQPYLDRFFDHYVRHVFTWREGLIATEFESPSGANRAPLLARARHLTRRLCTAMGLPRERVFETHSVVSAMAWQAEIHANRGRGSLPEGLCSPSRLKRAFAGRLARRQIYEFLGKSERLGLGANLPGRMGKSLCDDAEVFFAMMGALNTRELFAGGLFIQDEFLDAPEILSTMPLLPRSVGHFIEGLLESNRGELKWQEVQHSEPL